MVIFSWFDTAKQAVSEKEINTLLASCKVQHIFQSTCGNGICVTVWYEDVTTDPLSFLSDSVNSLKWVSSKNRDTKHETA